MDLQILVILTFLAAFFSMKAIAAFSTPGTGLSFLIRSPVFAPFSEKRSLKKNQASIKRLKGRFLAAALFSVLGIEFYRFLFSAFEFSATLKAWLFAPYIYLFTNLLGISAQCVGLLTKELPTDIHNHPYLAKSLSDFWGGKWNVWVSDWLAVMSKKLVPRSGAKRLLAAFALSGLFHEIIIALPYFLHTGSNVFGQMSLFFALQFAFVILDKKLFAPAPKAVRRAFMWFAILAPIQLFMNPAVMAFFGF